MEITIVPLLWCMSVYGFFVICCCGCCLPLVVINSEMDIDDIEHGTLTNNLLEN